MSACKTFSHQQVHQLLDEMLGPGLHADKKPILRLAVVGYGPHSRAAMVPSMEVTYRQGSGRDFRRSDQSAFL